MKACLPGNEFDYVALMGALKEYKRPRDKVTTLFYVARKSSG